MSPEEERPPWLPPESAPSPPPLPPPIQQGAPGVAPEERVGGPSAHSTSPVPSSRSEGLPQPQSQPSSTNGFAIASLILGIIGCSLLTPILALVFGLIGRSQIKKSNGQQKGLGLATAGAVLGACWIGFFLLIGGLGAAGVFDEPTKDISRAEFVREVSGAMESDPDFAFGDWPESSREDVRFAFRDYASCVYDVIKDDGPYLEAFYENPTEETTVYGLAQSEIDELESEIERVCVEQLRTDLEEVPGN